MRAVWCAPRAGPRTRGCNTAQEFLQQYWPANVGHTFYCSAQLQGLRHRRNALTHTGDDRDSPYSRTLRVACVVLLALTATPLYVGPPWISIELPGNPFDQTAKNAFLVVQAFHHGEPVEYPVAGNGPTAYCMGTTRFAPPRSNTHPRIPARSEPASTPIFASVSSALSP